MQLTTLLTQIAIMFLLMALGALCYRLGIITDRGSKDLSSLLLNLVSPCLIIHSFQRSFDPAMFGSLLQTLLLSVILMLLSIAVSAAAFRRRTLNYADKRMCVVFPNNGFMALPLLQALFGTDGVFIGSMFIVVTNIFIWTYGVQTLSRAAGENDGRIDWKRIVINPGTIGFCLGLLIFLFSVSLPEVISTPIEYLSSLNTPLAMLVLGVYLAQSKLPEILRDRSMYVVSLFRLLVVPLLSLAVILLLPFDSSVEQVMLLSISTPCAIASSMFAQLYGTNYRYSSRIIAFSTLLSALSMPLMIALYQMLTA